MKKLLSKKSTFFTLLILTLALLAFYVVMLVRPVSIGMTYKNEGTILGVTTTTKIVVNNSKSYTRTTKSVSGSNSSTTKSKGSCYVYNGYIFLNAELSAEDYKEWKKDIKENFDSYKILGIKTSAFQFGTGEDAYKCTGAVIFAVVGGVVEVTLIAFTIASGLLQSKKSKKKSRK